MGGGGGECKEGRGYKKVVSVAGGRVGGCGRARHGVCERVYHVVWCGVLCRTVHSQGRCAKQGWVKVRVRIKSVS